jgi:hypothetical protein
LGKYEGKSAGNCTNRYESIFETDGDTERGLYEKGVRMSDAEQLNSVSMILHLAVKVEDGYS